jgi:hypothetical protein
MASPKVDYLRNSPSDFVFMNPIEEEEVTFQNYPERNGWIYPTGSGATVTGRVYNVAITSLQCFKGYWSPSHLEQSPDPMDHVIQKRLQSPSAQLGGYDIYKFIEGVSKKTPVHQCECFYFQHGMSILNYTLVEIQETISNIANNFDVNTPICIPVNFGGHGYLERNHIVSIIIWNNVVDYYDSQGVFSKYKILKDGNSLRAVLEFLRDKFTFEGNIVENPYEHQNDIHNCGVFVCYRIYSIIIEENVIGNIEQAGPSLQKIQDFRKVINQIACTAPSPLSIP